MYLVLVHCSAALRYVAYEAKLLDLIYLFIETYSHI